MYSWLRTTLFLGTALSAIYSAPSDECPCDRIEFMSTCACVDSIITRHLKLRKRRDTGDGTWADSILSPETALKRASDDSMNAVFRWGKRHDDQNLNAVFRWGKRGTDGVSGYGNGNNGQNDVFRWGKRSIEAGYMPSDSLNLVEALNAIDAHSLKRIFRWGKRDQGPTPVFRWGKRSTEAGNPPVFRWGKRDYDDLNTNLHTLLFEWPGKRLDHSHLSADSTYAPVFRWGKRGSEYDNPSIFRWGKRQEAVSPSIFRWGKRTNDEPSPYELSDLEQS